MFSLNKVNRTITRAVEDQIERKLGDILARTTVQLQLPDDPVEWTQKVRILKGKPFSFEDREYLKQIYRDRNKQIYIVKPRQMEITEFALNWLLYHLTNNPGTVGLYLSDRQDHVSVFSKMRLRSWAIDQWPILQSMTKKKYNVSWQPFTNGSHLYMYSAWPDYEKARSIPADFVVIDEVQSTNVEAIPVLKESLSRSNHGRFLAIGTGSDEGDHWHKMWLEGNQQEWDPTSQKWIAKNPNSETSSYHISQIMASWLSKEVIERKRQTYTPRRYVNEVLGSFHKGTRKPLTQQDIRTLFDRTISFLAPEQVNYSLGPLYLGVDWGGGTKAFTIPWIWQCLEPDLPRFRLIYVSKIDERSTQKQAEMIGNLIDSYKIQQGVMDAGGAPYQVQRIEEMYPNTILKCRYLQRPEKPFEEKLEENMLLADRTWTIESVIDLITQPERNVLYPHGIPRILLPASDLAKVEWVVDHFTAIEAETVQLQSGKTYTRYTHPEELPDDALHACNYAYLAWHHDTKNRWFYVSG